jgi:hypothetical protein
MIVKSIVIAGALFGWLLLSFCWASGADSAPEATFSRVQMTADVNPEAPRRRR